MSAHIAKGIFRVFGCVSPGYLKLTYVRHLDEDKECIYPQPKEIVRVVTIRDDLWVDEVPIDLVPPESRMPNSLVELTVRNAREIIAVSSVKNEEA